jgi:hypothetical protein
MAKELLSFCFSEKYQKSIINHRTFYRGGGKTGSGFG